MFSALLLVFVAFNFSVTQGFAVVYRPSNPVMDYVPQNIGIMDKTYPEFTEPDCRLCHGTSTAVRHHNTEPALSGDCFFAMYKAPQLL
jgi:hypothetical protein